MPDSTPRRPTGAWTLALGAALLAGPAAAQRAPNGPPAPSPTQTGSASRTAAAITPIVGVVRDTAGAPLPDVQVVLAGVGRAVLTDEAGRFVFRGLAPGRYHLDAILLGYARGDADVVVPAEGADVQVAIVMRRTALRLSNVVVTATPLGADPLRLAQSTVDLSGKELARTLGASVAQTLSNEPGLAMRYNGPAASTPVIRGLSGERILVLQDGDRAGDLSAASADHGLSIDPLTANRIEVVRGPASLLYGTSALGGVVNVITNDIPTERPTHRDGYVAGQAESATPGGALAGGVALPLGRTLALTARGTFRRAEDLYQGGRVRLLNSDNRARNGLVSLAHIGEATRSGVSFGAYGFDYGLPTIPGGERARIEGARQELRAKADHTFGTGALRYLRAEGSAQWYTHDEVEEDGAVATTFDLRTQTANVTAKTRVGRLDGALGAQGLFRQYEASGEEALTPAAATTSGGLFLYQELPLGRAESAEEHGGDDHGDGVRLQVGARLDGFRLRARDGGEKFGPGRTRTFTNGSGSVGLSVPLAPRVTLGLSAARAFRAPTVEELFSNAFHAAVGTFDVGNPDLAAETNQGVDAVLRAQRGRVDASVSGYWNAIDNYVTPSIVGVVDEESGEPAAPGDAGAVPLNRFTQRDARLYGAEGRVEVAVLPHVIVGAMGDVVRGAFTGGGGALPYLPPARLGALARWEAGRLTASAETRHAFAQDRVSQGACGVAGGDVPETEPGTAGVPCVDLRTAGYTLVNASVGYNLLRGAALHSITLRADNLLDESYYDASSRIKSFARNPGRNLALVYRVQF
ncbi:TonB-dependent receptor [Roseisolibacter sp. H3M3-2]|uniref:TonB-dependent receptor n=1 Tax=Roseisolibacter sp. H3M3-2 TaxID=3031323 RepID=UPI0023D9B6AE|nr:TonB-dependent receptor [Roseisolibacter sp. H3M3-2]MDF1505482.1 TonB-dependent receptor [Roseisolibacter sp. H3M3-2]